MRYYGLCLSMLTLCVHQSIYVLQFWTMHQCMERISGISADRSVFAAPKKCSLVSQYKMDNSIYILSYGTTSYSQSMNEEEYEHPWKFSRLIYSNRTFIKLYMKNQPQLFVARN